MSTSPELPQVHLPPRTHSTNRSSTSSYFASLSRLFPSSDELLDLSLQAHDRGNLTQAFKYLQLAADGNSPLGLFLLGVSLRHGWGCQVNLELAYRYLLRAADFALIKSLTGQNEELGLITFELGVCLANGWGVKKDREKALRYFKSAGDLGSAEACAECGYYYSHGIGVKKDAKEGAMWYRKAAEGGVEMFGNAWIYKPKYNNND